VTFGDATSIDPSDPVTRPALGLSLAQEKMVAACEVARLRGSGGDDASCINLYATLRPTILGVGSRFIERGGFTFTSHAALDPSPKADAIDTPWRLLERKRDPEAPVPVILDQATAQWGLKLGGVGSRFQLDDDEGKAVAFEIVGLLEPGVLQGFVLVAERDFERIFPARSGYRMALVDASALSTDRRRALPRALAAAWTDAAPTVTPATRRLASLQAVQNTFLAGFQALGTLGLLLGTVGVAAVQAQGTLERLGSLAVLRAVGFTLARVRILLILETLAMVVLGLLAGVSAACLAVMPAILGSDAQLPIAWIAIAAGGALTTALLAATAAASQQVIAVRPQAE